MDNPWPPPAGSTFMFSVLLSLVNLTARGNFRPVLCGWEEFAMKSERAKSYLSQS